MTIFRDHAQLYWDAGLPVIPLKTWNSPAKGAGKAPILNEWTTYAENMPSEAMRSHWLASYPNSNIGLPFGPTSGLCAIDIDTDDPKLIDAILEALPPVVWKRVGQKGMGIVYRWMGQPNFKLRDSDNNSIVEFLGKGNQMVMPPSIHPKTGKPYTATADLWDILNQIPTLPVTVEHDLREALSDVAGISLAQGGRSGPVEVVPQGERDIQMVRRAGYYARVVLGIDKNDKFTLSQAMEHMRTWVEEFTSHANGDDMDPDKGVAKLVEFLLKDVEAGRTLPTGWDLGLTDEQKGHPAIKAMIEKNASQRWTQTKARDWLREQIALDPENPDHVMEKVLELTEATARDENFSKTEYATLFGYMKQEAGKILKLAKTDMMQAFNSARAGDVEQAADHEEIARQVIDEMERGGDLLFAQGIFWQWSGSCFKEMTEADITEVIAKSVKGNQLARRQNDYQAITKTVAMLARGELGTQLEDGINFANGFLDTNLELHDHSPKYGKTFTMPFNYIPERAGEAHKWLEFLEQCWGDDEDYADKVLALQEAMAATMFGMAPQYQRAFLLHGKPRTGKSQLMEVLRALMPENSRCSIPPTLWNERFQLSGMVGRALNLCGELPEESVISGDKFKMVVVGEELPTEFKGKDSFNFKPTAANWFASNFLPRTRDSSGGFTRRWLIFDFNRVVSNKERIVDFWKVLVAEEREAIAAWALQGLARLQRQGDYTQPASHILRLDQVKTSNNSVAAFLENSDKVRPTENMTDRADLRTIFDQYVFYMKDVSRGFSVTYERFRQMLDELGHECVPYVDATGVKRFEVHKVKIIGALTLPG